MKNKAVSIIGHFGGGYRFTDGQTVKTLNLYNELIRMSEWNIRKADTYYARKNPLRFVTETLAAVCFSRDIIILLSGNGMRLYFPPLSFLGKVFGKRIYHDVIGGNLATYYVQKYPKYRDYLNSFRVNWVETQKLKRELEEVGVNNAAILPNFRRFEPVDVKTLEGWKEEVYRFCTFSRVAREKGIETAAETVQSINERTGKKICSLDIYGPVDESFRERFERLMAESTEAVRYMGEVPSEEAVDTIKNYYGLLFPTFWDGESQAGTISESLAAGVPVLATDWHCNGEMITNGYNGLLYPSAYAENLEQAIYWLISQQENIVNLKQNCIKSAEYYCPDIHVRHIMEFVETQ